MSTNTGNTGSLGRKVNQNSSQAISQQEKKRKKPGRIKGREIQKISINEAIPQELLLLIFSKLPPPTLAKVINLVCKEWNQLASDNQLWRKISGYSIEEMQNRENNYLPPGAGGVLLDRDWRKKHNLKSLAETIVHQELQKKVMVEGRKVLGIAPSNILVSVEYSSIHSQYCSRKEIIQAGKQKLEHLAEAEKHYQLGIQVVIDLLSQYDKTTDLKAFVQEKIDLTLLLKDNSDSHYPVVNLEELQNACITFIQNSLSVEANKDIPLKDLLEGFSNFIKTYVSGSLASAVVLGIPVVEGRIIQIGKCQQKQLEQEERDYMLGLKREIARLKREKFQLPTSYTEQYSSPSISLYVIATYTREKLIEIGKAKSSKEGTSSILKNPEFKEKIEDKDEGLAYYYGKGLERYRKRYPKRDAATLEKQINEKHSQEEITALGRKRVSESKNKKAKASEEKTRVSKVKLKKPKEPTKQPRKNDYKYSTKQKGKKKVVESSSSSSSSDEKPLKRKNRKK